MAKREYYANWQVTHGEGKDVITMKPGETRVLDDGEEAVKRLVKRGALTPLPAKGVAAAGKAESKAGK